MRSGLAAAGVVGAAVATHAAITAVKRITSEERRHRLTPLSRTSSLDAVSAISQDASDQVVKPPHRTVAATASAGIQTPERLQSRQFAASASSSIR